METPSRLEFTRVVESLRAGDERAADAVAHHLAGVDAAATGEPEPIGPRTCSTHGWKPEPWA